MSTDSHRGDFTQDQDLADWIVGVLFKKPRPAGRFLTSIASAARHADPAGYAILRPVIVQLKRIHPEFSARAAIANSSKQA